MVLLETPICDFDTPAIDFSLPATDGKTYSLKDCVGDRGLLVMFICNHCPYVKAIRERLVITTKALEEQGVGVVAIMSNDMLDYPEDSFENMGKVAQRFGFNFPYLLDESQEVAKAYGAVCTPDFFGYNADLKLQYRGRLDDGVLESPAKGAPQELLEAMTQVARTGQGPQQQTPSMGCSIKWRS